MYFVTNILLLMRVNELSNILWYYLLFLKSKPLKYNTNCARIINTRLKWIFTKWLWLCTQHPDQDYQHSRPPLQSLPSFSRVASILTWKHHDNFTCCLIIKTRIVCSFCFCLLSYYVFLRHLFQLTVVGPSSLLHSIICI